MCLSGDKDETLEPGTLPARKAQAPYEAPKTKRALLQERPSEFDLRNAPNRSA